MYRSQNVESAELTALSEESKFSRFKGADWFNTLVSKNVIVGGAGGIGSWTIFLLARIGCTLTVFDFDKIDPTNLGGQLFKTNDIGKYKTRAISNIISEFSDSYISVYDKYKVKSFSTEVMISCFDNMKARKIFFNNWVKTSTRFTNPIFIDGRLNMESWQIFCVTKDKIQEYKEHLFDDSEVEDVECTMKQTSHCAAMIASHMVGFLTNHFSEKRQVPFFYEYILPVNFVNLKP